jgi:hypothetical protein
VPTLRPIIPFLLLAIYATAQSAPPNRLTFSGAWSRQISGYVYQQQKSALGVGLSYGYRVHRYVELEAGFLTALNPTGEVCYSHGCEDVGDRFHWVPFGVRFIAPLYLGRVEFSGGGGGLYEKYTVGNTPPGGGYYSRSGWGGYFVGSTAIALDRSRHYWLSATPRWFLANPPYNRDRWFQLSGEFSIRF